MAQDTAADFAVAAFLEDASWTVVPLPVGVAQGLDPLTTALRQLPAEAGAIGFVGVDDDFFVVVRLRGAGVQVLLSDATAADEWPIAQEVLDILDIDVPEDDEDVVPVGELDILADLGLSSMDLSIILGDVEAYPDELLSQIAERLGFGAEFDRAVETAR